MKNYLLPNYSLSNCQLAKSLILSEYGLRHLEEAKKHPERKWGHYIIAAIEFCPVLGILVSLIERVVAKCFLNTFSYAPNPPSIPSNNTTQNVPIHPPIPNVNLLPPLAKKHWVFRGTQIGCEGSATIAKVHAVFSKILKQKEKGITFNKDKITGLVTGGTCSSMSLEFVDQYLKLKKAHPSLFTPQQRAKLLFTLEVLGKEFATSSEEMRVRQAAFNTIELERADKNIDYSRNKVQSLANFHHLNLDHASPEIDIERCNEEELDQHITALPSGSYLVRMLKPANNEKDEEKGHSVIYIKEPNAEFFYDPNFGLRDLQGEKHSSILFDAFKDCFAHFNVSKTSFYRFAT